MHIEIVRFQNAGTTLSNGFEVKYMNHIFMNQNYCANVTVIEHDRVAS